MRLEQLARYYGGADPVAEDARVRMAALVSCVREVRIGQREQAREAAGQRGWFALVGARLGLGLVPSRAEAAREGEGLDDEGSLAAHLGDADGLGGLDERYDHLLHALSECDHTRADGEGWFGPMTRLAALADNSGIHRLAFAARAARMAGLGADTNRRLEILTELHDHVASAMRA